MAEKYFDKFPIINYANTQVVDITRRTVLLDKVSRSPYLYYPYDIVENERADQFSFRYYKDPFQSWIVYLTNKIVDPYYEWYMSERQLQEFCDKKYDSSYVAQQKVKFYRNDWIAKETIDVSNFNALTVGAKKYWEPVYGTGDNVLAYKRKEKDWTINTNKVATYSVANTSFKQDEICSIVFNNNFSGRGQIAAVSNNSIYLNHLMGTFVSNSTVAITGNSYIYGTESEVNVAFTSSTLICNNIPAEEEIYWQPVSYYQFEQEKNEFNKTIRVLDSKYSETISDNLRQLLRD
jgi:hypothetical protein